MHPPLRLDVRAKALQRVRPANQHQSQRQARRDQDKPPHANNPSAATGACVFLDMATVAQVPLVTGPQPEATSRGRDTDFRQERIKLWIGNIPTSDLTEARLPQGSSQVNRNVYPREAIRLPISMERKLSEPL